MERNAQGAIEYLLIIGAAILVVTIVIIAMTGITNTGKGQVGVENSGLDNLEDQLHNTSCTVESKSFLSSSPQTTTIDITYIDFENQVSPADVTLNDSSTRCTSTPNISCDASKCTISNCTFPANSTSIIGATIQNESDTITCGNGTITVSNAPTPTCTATLNPVSPVTQNTSSAVTLNYTGFPSLPTSPSAPTPGLCNFTAGSCVRTNSGATWDGYCTGSCAFPTAGTSSTTFRVGTTNCNSTSITVNPVATGTCTLYVNPTSVKRTVGINPNAGFDLFYSGLSLPRNTTITTSAGSCTVQGCNGTVDGECSGSCVFTNVGVNQIVNATVGGISCNTSATSTNVTVIDFVPSCIFNSLTTTGPTTASFNISYSEYPSTPSSADVSITNCTPSGVTCVPNGGVIYGTCTGTCTFSTSSSSINATLKGTSCTGGPKTFTIPSVAALVTMYPNGVGDLGISPTLTPTNCTFTDCLDVLSDGKYRSGGGSVLTETYTMQDITKPANASNTINSVKVSVRGGGSVGPNMDVDIGIKDSTNSAFRWVNKFKTGVYSGGSVPNELSETFLYTSSGGAWTWEIINSLQAGVYMGPSGSGGLSIDQVTIDINYNTN